MNLLKVDMTKKHVIAEPFPHDQIFGGRGLIDLLANQYGSPTADPLSPESPFVVAPGLLAGTSAPQSGRLSVGGKSPLTGGIKEANSGGTGAQKLGHLGIKGIMVTGKSDAFQVLKIDAQGATLEDAGDIVGLPNYDACAKLTQRHGDKAGIIIIGLAGEMKLANSTVAVTDPDGRPSRHAARGGVGAMMGAKRLKAIVIDDSNGKLRQPVDPEAFKNLVKDATDFIKNYPVTEPLHAMGTALFLDIDNARGSFPTNNHRAGSFDQISTGKYMETLMSQGGTAGHACMAGCVVRCSPLYHEKSGAFVTAALEYETIAMLGANLGIGDMDAIARMDRRCDDLGLDTIEMGATIGILNDVGKFTFGDAKQAEAYIDEIAKGTPLGRVLGNGVVATAREFGITRVPAVKGQAIPAHAARSSKGWAVTYASSPQGADHTAGPVMDDPLSPTGHVERSRMAQMAVAALDSAGFCVFSSLYERPDLVAGMISSLYGVNWTVNEYMGMGAMLLKMEQGFNLKAGIGPEADRIPEWMRTEPLPPTNAVFDVSQEDIDAVLRF